MTALKYILSIATMLITHTALATPGDIGCYSDTGKMKVEVLIGYDHHGQLDPSLLEVTVEGKKVFTSTDVTLGIINVGTEEQPFTNGLIQSEEGKTWVKIRVPEQNSSSSEFEVFMNAVVVGGLLFNEYPLICER